VSTTPQRKLNIGAGLAWRTDGWEVLDAMRGAYPATWQHRGFVWDSKLSGHAFDIIYTSHTLEHIPHFKIESSIAEINRIMKVGGILRISVPDLEKAVLAYVNKDREYFCNKETIHNADHMGFGSLLLNQIISPGHQTIAFDSFLNPVGSYGHTYNYDFEMMRILLEKWGFDYVVKSEFCRSAVEEMRQAYTIMSQDKQCAYSPLQADVLVKTGAGFFTGFDNKPGISLFIEARKKEDKFYNPKFEFDYNRRNRLDTEIAWMMKAKVFRVCSNVIDYAHHIYRKVLLLLNGN